MTSQERDPASLAWLDRAVALARDSERVTHPNPRVGCVLTNNGKVIGEGVTSASPGGPHAEIEALAAAADGGFDIRGAHAYVSLEPCCHHGRTPPCTDALIAAGVARVVCAMRDPDPRVSGGGFKALESSGIQTATGTAAQADVARKINSGFFSRVERGRPELRVKLATSLDGRTAMASGESKWITGDAARADVQQLRSRADAILTGVGTVIADNPRLTVRLPESNRQPLRVIADSALRTPPGSQLFDLDGPVLIACAQGAGRDAREALVARGAQVTTMGTGSKVDLRALLEELGRREINSVHTECGAGLAGALIEAGLVDELVVYLAPRLIGADGLPSVILPGTGRLVDTPAFALSDIVRVGDDVRLTLANAG